MINNHFGDRRYNYFDRDMLDSMQKAINLLVKYNDVQQKLTSNVGRTAQEYQDLLDVSSRYEAQLQAMGVDTRTNVAELQRQYNMEMRLYQARQDEEKRAKTERRETEKFDRLIATGHQQELKYQNRLSDLRTRAIREASDITKTEKERNEALERYSKMYNRLRQQQQRDNAKRNATEKAIGSIFGTTSEDIQAVKDGTYGMKVASDIFAKAVGAFKDAVKQWVTNGIDTNYNSTEATLNRITASNRMSWNSGNFNFGSKSYTGYSKLNNAINDQLSADGLFNNISNVDVMEAVANLTSASGFGLDQAIAKGYQDTVIKYIVPYLDTTSEAFEMLEMTMPRYVKKCSSY